MELLCKPENEETVGGKGEEAGENGEGDVEDENDSLLGKPNIDQGDDEFKELYYNAWKQGCKGITTFRASGKRYGILNEVKDEPKAEACFIDPSTGQKECD